MTSGAVALRAGFAFGPSAGLRRGGAAHGRDGGRGFDFDLGLAEGAFEFVERDFAGTQGHVPAPDRTSVPLRQTSRVRRVEPGGGDHGRGARGQLRMGVVRAAFGQQMQLLDQVLVAAFRFGLGGLEPGENFLDAIDRGQDQRDGAGGDRHAVAEFAHQGLAGMGQRFQPRQAEEAAGALDGVHQAEDVIQNLRVVRVLLEPHQLIVDRIQALVGLRQEFPQKIIHLSMPFQT